MTEPFDAVDVIRTKRDGGAVPEPALRWLIDAYTREYVADAQMAAFAMAVLLNGMTREEIHVMTDAMIASGERMSFAGLGKPTADKHSTGGVGDKITLPLAPLVATFGVAVPQLSGRGLGHTGGTLDKLESIPGWRAALTNDEMHAQLKGDVGAVICAAGSGLAPADKRLYALRDVTGTVEAIPLIASSIMSKKIAEGTDSLVLDVKFGSGAFMKDEERARELARTMVALGADSGVKTTALLTDMSTPLGLAVGNANEVRESVEVLAGGGPADVVELTVALAREMLRLAGVDADPADALRDGRAMDTWRRMIRAQDGDPDAPLPQPRETHVVTAERDGILQRLDAYDVGIAAWRLGAGRARATDPVVHAAGIDLHAKPGDAVRAGQPLATLNADDAGRFDRALEALAGAYEIGDTAPEAAPIVRDRITA
ncbi:MAG TPA: thymidine phosphorylase [Microbacterium sp.]|nr:thymidine phosphorylase [Microbacterium sp.]